MTTSIKNAVPVVAVPVVPVVAVDTASLKSAFSFLSDAIAAVEGGLDRGKTLSQKCADLLVSLKFKPELTASGNPRLPESLTEYANAAIAKGLLSAGRWTKAQYALVIGGAERAKALNTSAERNSLVMRFPQYRLRLAEKMVSHYPDLEKEIAETATAKKAVKDAKAKTSGVSDTPEQAEPSTEVQGINPASSLEAYKAGINVLITATVALGELGKLGKMDEAGDIVNQLQSILRSL